MSEIRRIAMILRRRDNLERQTEPFHMDSPALKTVPLAPERNCFPLCQMRVLSHSVIDDSRARMTPNQTTNITDSMATSLHEANCALGARC